MALSISEGD